MPDSHRIAYIWRHLISGTSLTMDVLHETMDSDEPQRQHRSTGILPTKDLMRMMMMMMMMLMMGHPIREKKLTSTSYYCTEPLYTPCDFSFFRLL